MEDDSFEISSEFSDPDEYEDLHDLSMAKQNLPKERMDTMGQSASKDMDYEGAKHHDEIPGSVPTHRKRYNQYDGNTYHDCGSQSNPQSDEMGYYLKTYGTPDPDMESETLADRKKNAPLNFHKMTGKDKYSHENKVSWAEKKERIAQRAEKEAARAAAKERRLAAASLKPGINESKKSIRLTESQLIDLVKRMVNEAKG